MKTILTYLARKLLYSYLVLLGVLMIVFFFFHILPGDPVSIILGGKPRTPEMREMVAKAYGLDKSPATQFMYYINDFSPISMHQDTPENEREYKYTKLFSVGEKYVLVLKTPYLRRSFRSNKRVDEMISGRLEGTFWLASSAMLLATFFGIGFGMIAALNYNTSIDRLVLSISTLGISAPSFVTAILMSMTFGYYLGEYTGLPPYGYMWEVDVQNGGQKLMLERLVLPCITLGIRPMAIIAQLARSSMIEVLSKDFIRTAKAKGLDRTTVIMKHALKNALNPVVTAISGWLASLMAGAFFVEFIFNWKGIGMETIDAVRFLDMPVILAMTMLIACIFVVVNIIVDGLYSLLDPRVRLK